MYSGDSWWLYNRTQHIGGNTEREEEESSSLSLLCNRSVAATFPFLRALCWPSRAWLWNATPTHLCLTKEVWSFDPSVQKLIKGNESSWEKVNMGECELKLLLYSMWNKNKEIKHQHHKAFKERLSKSHLNGSLHLAPLYYSRLDGALSSVGIQNSCKHFCLQTWSYNLVCLKLYREIYRSCMRLQLSCGDWDNYCSHCKFKCKYSGLDNLTRQLACL